MRWVEAKTVSLSGSSRDTAFVKILFIFLSHFLARSLALCASDAAKRTHRQLSPPPKSTPKRESSAQGIVGGMSQGDACKQVYDAENVLPAIISDNAYKRVRHPEVSLRIHELRDQLTAGKAWSFAHGMEEVETNITKARELNQRSAAIRGTQPALKPFGLLTVRHRTRLSR